MVVCQNNVKRRIVVLFDAFGNVVLNAVVVVVFGFQGPRVLFAI